MAGGGTTKRIVVLWYIIFFTCFVLQISGVIPAGGSEDDDALDDLPKILL